MARRLPKLTDSELLSDAHAEAPGALPQALPDLLQEARRVLQPSLTGLECEHFHKLTGLALHAVWRDSLDRPCPEALLCPRACPPEGPTRKVSAQCRRCSQVRWNSREGFASKVCRIEGLCGQTSLCIAVRAGSLCPVTLVAQKPLASAGPGPSLNACGATRPRQAEPPESSQKSAALTLAERLLSSLHYGLQRVWLNFMDRAATKDNGLLLRLVAENARLRNQPRRRHLEAPEAPRLLAERRAQPVVDQMLDYLVQHYDQLQEASLADLAAHLKMNADYLSDLFSRTAGVTFHKCHNELRILRAHQLLEETSLPIHEVGVAVGFVSLKRFREFFTTCEGVSPADWRRAHQPGSRAGALLK